jgi:ABC-type multidrug transport system ATPase subunit
LALRSGRENEIWPPFATIVMGGLVTSTLLTLLVVPVGFIFLRRLDRLFGRIGPWAVLAWLATTTAIMLPLVLTDTISSLFWQIATTLLVGGGLLAAMVLVLRRPESAEPTSPLVLEARCLRKVYGLPGPIGRAWRLPEIFARKVLARGGVAFDPRRSRERLLSLVLVAMGVGYLAVRVQSTFWTLVLLLATAFVLGRIALEVRRGRGLADRLGRVRPGGIEGALAAGPPWIALLVFASREWLLPQLAGEVPAVSPWALAIAALGLALVQLGRRTAHRMAAGELAEHPAAGPLRSARSLWRRGARALFGLDLPRDEVLALAGFDARFGAGMIGILGPNGAGKTTLLRQLAGILDPTRGRITLGGAPLAALRRHLARWVGYLPQDAGLPPNLTAREYLTYYATLYELPAGEREERVAHLLREVGLAERADERIGGFSGGMRQRVAVARTLLRLPPVIIVDEPTVGLDPRERIRFRNLLVELARERIVLFSTHVVEDVAVACDRTLVLVGGRKVFDGPPAELAGLAQGRVWEATLTAAEGAELGPEVLVADQVPSADGRARYRLLTDTSPHRLAEAVVPTLEDGYLVLTGGTAA